jgi:putative SOS response-associated peptidase YedK
MCNRVRASFEFREVKVRWNLFNDLPQFKPIYNISPHRQDADVLAIVRTETGNEGRLMSWPLVPCYEKTTRLTYSTMNARVEGLRQSRTYRRLLDQRRCIIPVDGFYEFQGEKPPKTPWFFYLRSKEPFALAGLWDTWKKPDGSLLNSFTIIVTEPNDFVRRIHDRMPVILRREDEEKWLDCTTNPFEKAEAALQQFPSDLMDAHITSTRVNNPRYNLPDCGEPADEQGSLAL